MRLLFAWPGKTKEAFAREGIRKYLGELGAFARAEVVEIREEKDRPPKEALRREGERILKAVADYVLLDVQGKAMGSEELARMLGRKAEWAFVVGGAYGVSEEVRAKAAFRLSFGPMTFPHELARVMLLEQVWRAMNIMKGTGYHHA